jgi:Leucine-rich repeat (LRR) protein
MGCQRIVLLACLMTLMTALEAPWILETSSRCALNLTAYSLPALPTMFNTRICAIVASHNKLSGLENTTFSSAEDLQEIVLTHNKIRELEAGTFGSLRNLQHLDLGYNRIILMERCLGTMDSCGFSIWNIIFLVTSARHFFKNCLKLKNLNIGSNEITSGSPMWVLLLLIYENTTILIFPIH